MFAGQIEAKHHKSLKNTLRTMKVFSCCTQVQHAIETIRLFICFTFTTQPRRKWRVYHTVSALFAMTKRLLDTIQTFSPQDHSVEREECMAPLWSTQSICQSDTERGIQVFIKKRKYPNNNMFKESKTSLVRMILPYLVAWLLDSKNIADGKVQSRNSQKDQRNNDWIENDHLTANSFHSNTISH